MQPSQAVKATAGAKRNRQWCLGFPQDHQDHRIHILKLSYNTQWFLKGLEETRKRIVKASTSGISSAFLCLVSSYVVIQRERGAKEKLQSESFPFSKEERALGSHRCPTELQL